MQLEFKMKIISDFKNSLLNRREIVFVIGSEANPGKTGANKAIIDKFKTHEENIVIKKIMNNFGKKDFVIEAFVYNSKKDKEMIERKPKIKKTTDSKEAK